MATAIEHQNKWQHHRQFLSGIPDSCPDWMMTAAYQTAVHAAECLLRKDATGHSVGGASLHQTLKTNPRYRSIWKCLRPLFEASQVARNQCDTAKWMSVDEVKAKLIGERLGSLEQLVMRLMSLDRNAFRPIVTAVEPANKIQPIAAPIPVAQPVEIDPLALPPMHVQPKVEQPVAAPAPVAPASERKGLFVPSGVQMMESAA